MSPANQIWSTYGEVLLLAWRLSYKENVDVMNWSVKKNVTLLIVTMVAHVRRIIGMYSG
jgi:uncharacterized sodium:solute symporter family permease YidK